MNETSPSSSGFFYIITGTRRPSLGVSTWRGRRVVAVAVGSVTRGRHSSERARRDIRAGPVALSREVLDVHLLSSVYCHI